MSAGWVDPEDALSQHLETCRACKVIRFENGHRCERKDMCSMGSALYGAALAQECADEARADAAAEACGDAEDLDE